MDGDPHLILLSARNLGFSYQNSYDEYSRLVHETSNEMEMIYLSAGGEDWDDACTLAHEFQQVIQWAVNPNEETWMNEYESFTPPPFQPEVTYEARDKPYFP